jgi:hypothetical protein
MIDSFCQNWNYFLCDLKQRILSLDLNNLTSLNISIDSDINTFEKNIYASAADIFGIYIVYCKENTSSEQCVYIGKGAPISKRLSYHNRSAFNLTKNEPIKYHNLWKNYIGKELTVYIYPLKTPSETNPTEHIGEAIRKEAERFFKDKYRPILMN